MKNIYESFELGFKEGWSSFWSPFIFMLKQLKKIRF